MIILAWNAYLFQDQLCIRRLQSLYTILYANHQTLKEIQNLQNYNPQNPKILNIKP
jgi:hypothetical protein